MYLLAIPCLIRDPPPRHSRAGGNPVKNKNSFLFVFRSALRAATSYFLSKSNQKTGVSVRYSTGFQELFRRQNDDLLRRIGPKYCLHRMILGRVLALLPKKFPPANRAPANTPSPRTEEWICCWQIHRLIKISCPKGSLLRGLRQLLTVLSAGDVQVVADGASRANPCE